MPFYTYKDVEVKINNKKMLVNSLELSQNVEMLNPVWYGESVSERNVVGSPIVNSLRLSYYLTGFDPLKDYLYSTRPLSGDICGIKFNNGYISNYSLSAEPHSPLNVSVEIPIFDECTGAFSPITATGINRLNFLHFSNSYFNYSTNYSKNSLSNNIITNFEWQYQADIIPSYSYRQTGVTYLSPHNVTINNKNISCRLSCDLSDISLPFTGESFAIGMRCPLSNNEYIYEEYECSGMLSSKNFGINSDSLSKTDIEIKQSHLNEKPLIGSVITYTYPSLGNLIYVISSNASANGFTSRNENLNLIERIKIGDTYVPFTVSHGSLYDTIAVEVTDDVIDGFLTLETLKGIIQYPVPLDLNFSSPFVTTISPITGSAHSKVTINGLNFNRITDVRFNGLSANFSLIQNTGATHSIAAYVPDGATIGKITVLSETRNVSGISSQTFYPDIRISSFSPTTGIWGSTITISGQNFSGVNGVYFNGISAQSFVNVSENIVTAVAPANTTVGFPRGKITVKSSNGISGTSNKSYRPLFPITGLSVISGTSSEDMAIGVLYANTSFLNQSGLGYKVSFGDNTAYFLKKDNYTFTGLIPNGFIGNDFISFYEPDGITQYPGFTGKFYGIGPAPTIKINTAPNGSLIPDVSPNTFTLYSTNSISIGGENMKDFFGLPSYLFVSGHGTIFEFSDVTVSQLNNRVTVNNVRITGEPTKTGYYDMYLRNFAGTGNIAKSGLLISPATRIIPDGALITNSAQFNGTNFVQFVEASDKGTTATSKKSLIKNVFVPGYETTITMETGTIHTVLFQYDGNRKTLNHIEVYMSPYDTTLQKMGPYYLIESDYFGGAVQVLYPGVSRSGIIEVITGLSTTESIFNNNFALDNAYSEDRFVAFSDNALMTGYKKSFPTPITNVVGIRIRNSEQAIGLAEYNGNFANKSASCIFPISEVVLY